MVKFVQAVVCQSAVIDKIGGAHFAVQVEVAYRYKTKYEEVSNLSA